MNALLTRLAALLTRSPLRALLLLTLPCITLCLYALQVPLDLSFTGIVDRNNPELMRYLDWGERMKLTGRMYLLLEGEEEQLREHEGELRAALEGVEGVERVEDFLPIDWMKQEAPYLIPPELFEQVREIASGEGGGWASLGEELREQAGELSLEGHRVLTVVLAEEPMNLPLGESPYPLVEAACERVLQDSGLTHSLSGVAAFAHQDQERTLSRIQALTPISLLLVLLILTRVEKSPLRLACIALPMLLAAGSTLGLVGAMLGSLTVMETFFGVMIFGLGVDFALHLGTRLKELRGEGRDRADCLRIALTGTGRGVIAGAMTTIIAFLVLSTAPEPTALHLGLSGGIGLLCCLFLMLTWFPASWSLIERWRPGPNHGPPGAMLVGLTRGALRHPALTAGSFFLVWLVSLTGVHQLRFETDLERIFNREVPAVQAADRLQELMGMASQPWILPADSLETLQEWEAALEDEPLFSHLEGVHRWIPEDRSQRAEALRAMTPELRAARQSMVRSLPLAFGARGRQLEEGITILRTLERAAERGPPELDELPPSLQEQLLPQGQPVLLAYPSEPHLDGARSRAEREVLSSLGAEPVGFGTLLEVMVESNRPWIPGVALGTFVLVSALLWIDQRQWKWVALTLVPVLFGAGFTLGVLCWLNFGFSLLTLAVIPLILGLGIDDGIHVVHRLREEPDRETTPLIASVGQAIELTTLTTCSSFAVLLFSDHPGIESMAWVMLIGLPSCLLASITLLPVLAESWGLRPRTAE